MASDPRCKRATGAGSSGSYQRRTADSADGYRNGWQQPRTLKTSLGPVQLQRPKLRHAHAALCDQLFGQGISRTNALETLVISCWVRGLSDRDVEAMGGRGLRRAGGQPDHCQPDLPAAARRVRRLVPPRPDQGRHRLPGPGRVVLQAAPKAKAEPVLVAWGISTDGKPVFLGLAPGAAESSDAWRALLADLKDRGLGAPLLVISDGGKGLCTAIERSFLASLHQRCLVHVCRNLIAKVPTHAQDRVKRDYWAIFDQIQAEGEAAVAEARRRAKRFLAKWQPRYPTAVACVTDNLLFPAEHRKRIRHSNLIERTFGETRRRVKVIGRQPGEQSCLSLVWAVLDRASKGWRGLTMTPKALRRLQDLRRELLGQPRPPAPQEVSAQTVTAAA